MIFADAPIVLNWYNVFILFMIAHWFADYAWQSDFISEAKNPGTVKGKVYWKHVLPAHAGIHAGLVFLITGFPTLFLFEFISHFVIDYLKCKSKISLNTDQFLHILCKVIWTVYFLHICDFMAMQHFTK